MQRTDRTAPPEVSGSRNEEFASALFEPSAPLPEGVIGPRGKKAEKRFAVYRNNVVVSLVAALADIFPAVQSLLGDKAFTDVARIFIARSPPTSPLLFEYGRRFPAFLKDFAPLSAYPFLPDLARLERAWLDGFHAADTKTLGPEEFAATDQSMLGELVFTPHPATALVEGNFAIVTLMNHCRENLPLDEINPGLQETALVTRPENLVEVRSLPGGGAIFFRLLLDGRTLGVAADAATTADPAFDLSAAISALIQSGAFSAAEIRPVEKQQGRAE